MVFFLTLLRILVRIVAIVYLYRRAKDDKSKNPILWAILAFLSPVLAIVIYLILEEYVRRRDVPYEKN